MHGDLKLIESGIERLREKVFDAQLKQEEYEDQSGFFERLLEHYLSTQKSLSDLIEKTKGLAVKDLKLEFDGLSK